MSDVRFLVLAGALAVSTLGIFALTFSVSAALTATWWVYAAVVGSAFGERHPQVTDRALRYLHMRR